MAQGAATAADCPGTYDVVVNGYGYMLLASLEPSLPFRTHRAVYSHSATFVDRSNVSNAYGDNAQDFFLNDRQRDWSLGEQQKFFRTGTDGRYWLGSNVDVSTPGQVRLAQAFPSVGFAAAVSACSRDTNGQKLIAASATSLYTIDSAGTITDNGAHGLGAAPSKFGLVSDGGANYLSTTSGGTVGVRKWNGSSYSTFAASAADSLCFLNNTLFGYRAASGDLVRYDTAGTATSLNTWKGASGTANTGAPNTAVLEAFGGKLLILLNYGQIACELWIYDGTGVSLLHIFPPNYIGSDLEVLYGVAYVSGAFFRAATTSSQYNRPAIHFFDGSQVGLLWQANDYNATASSDTFGGPHPAIVASGGRLVFTDDTMATLLAYNPALGGVSTIGSYTAGGTDTRLAATGYALLHTRNATTAYRSGNVSYQTSGYVISSLIDFESSLTKLFRGVKVEWDPATDGDGGSVDVAYQIDSLTGAFTTLKTGAVSGTEYPGDGTSIGTGHAVSVKITLNKGTSTAGPTLKSCTVRAAPVLPTYKLREYTLDLSGIGLRDDTVRLADGTFHPLAGHQQADNLEAAVTTTTPFQVSDRFINTQTSVNGTTTTTSFTALCVPASCEIYEVAEGWDNPQSPGGYVAKIVLREV